MPSLRLLSVDAHDHAHDHADVPRRIAAAEADVACVHGAPHLLRWRSGVARLARLSGLVVAAGGRPAGANVVLSTLGVDLVAGRELGFTGAAGLHPPGAALAALRRLDASFVVVGATLVGNAAVRVGQARELQAAIDSLVPDDLPSVLSVQGVDRPGTAAWEALLAGRVGVAGRLFVDRRIAVAEPVEQSDGAVVVELTI